MAYAQDILNLIGDDCLDFKITIIGNSGVICEGFKSIVKFSVDRLVIRAGKAIIGINGNEFSIKELAQSYIQLKGKVISLERLDAEQAHDKK